MLWTRRAFMVHLLQKVTQLSKYLCRFLFHDKGQCHLYWYEYIYIQINGNEGDNPMGAVSVYTMGNYHHQPEEIEIPI